MLQCLPGLFQSNFEVVYCRTWLFRDLPSFCCRLEQGVLEVSPEFLAALPPNIQEEVLAQQRLEQQRTAVTTNPNEPVDPADFLQVTSFSYSVCFFLFFY